MLRKAIEQKAIIDFQQDRQDAEEELAFECDNCGSENGKTTIVGIDDEYDEVYYATRCNDCGVLNE